MTIHAGDSYVVYITPPSDTFPLISVVRRKRNRARGKIEAQVEILHTGSKDAFDSKNIDQTAKIIGEAILKDSQIIQQWKTGRP